MQGTQSTTQGNGAGPESTTERDIELAAAFRPNELVWLVSEHYVPTDESWIVDIVRKGLQGRWMRQRYRYDVPSGVIYFLGERPVTNQELSDLRRSGKVFPVGELQQKKKSQGTST